MKPTNHDLRELFIELYRRTPALKLFISDHLQHMPAPQRRLLIEIDWQTSLLEVTAQLVEELDTHGLVDTRLQQALLDAWPGRQAEITAVFSASRKSIAVTVEPIPRRKKRRVKQQQTQMGGELQVQRQRVDDTLSEQIQRLGTMQRQSQEVEDEDQ